MVSIILLISFFVAVWLAIPIAWTLGISSVWALLFMDVPLNTVPQKILTGMDVFPLICMPFFMLAGEIMAAGGITTRLLDFAVMVVGRIRGGLSISAVLASMIFAGITGSGVADASAVGSTMIPMMTKNGYDKPFAAAVAASAGVIGPIIPPSVAVIIYSMAVPQASIGGLLLAGVIPGIMIGLSLMILCYIISRKRGYPKRTEKYTRREIILNSKNAILALLMPGIILGGIAFGICTATEAAAVAVIYAFLVSFIVYKELHLNQLPKMFLRTGVSTAVIMIIIGTSNLFGMVLAFEQFALKLEILLKPLGYVGFLLVVNIVLLIAGTFMDQNPLMLILGPVFAPIAHNLGIDPLQFGMIFIINIVLGMLTPPVGAVLFVISSISSISVVSLTKAVLPFLFAEIAVLMIVTFVPFCTLWLPKMFGYIR